MITIQSVTNPDKIVEVDAVHFEDVCVECIHYRTGDFCLRSAKIEMSPVTGLKVVTGRKSASKERDYSRLSSVFLSKCGIQGAFYEQS